MRGSVRGAARAHKAKGCPYRDRILAECAEQAQRTLAEHRDQLDHLAQVLLERETLDEADAYAVAGIPRPGASAQPVVAQA